MTLSEYMELPYCMEIVPDKEEGGMLLHFRNYQDALPVGALELAASNAEDAKWVWFLAAMEEDQEIPRPDGLDNYSGQFKLRIPKSLHKQLSEQSKREGISMNQYCLYLLSRNDAIHSQCSI